MLTQIMRLDGGEKRRMLGDLGTRPGSLEPRNYKLHTVTSAGGRRKGTFGSGTRSPILLATLSGSKQKSREAPANATDCLPAGQTTGKSGPRHMVGRCRAGERLERVPLG